MPAILVAIALLVAAAAPIGQPVATRTLVVRGTVTDSGSARPLANAMIDVLASGEPRGIASTLSDSAGRYVLAVRLADSAKILRVRARLIGYHVSLRHVPVRADTLVVDFKLGVQGLQLEQVVVTSTATRVDDLKRAAATSTATAAVGSRSGDTARLRRTTGDIRARSAPWNTEEYSRIEDNRFLSVASAPLSTFSVDVDRASYTNVRRYVNQGTLPPKDAARSRPAPTFVSRWRSRATACCCGTPSSGAASPTRMCWLSPGPRPATTAGATTSSRWWNAPNRSPAASAFARRARGEPPFRAVGLLVGL